MYGGEFGLLATVARSVPYRVFSQLSVESGWLELDNKDRVFVYTGKMSCAARLARVHVSDDNAEK